MPRCGNFVSLLIAMGWAENVRGLGLDTIFRTPWLARAFSPRLPDAQEPGASPQARVAHAVGALRGESREAGLLAGWVRIELFSHSSPGCRRAMNGAPTHWG